MPAARCALCDRLLMVEARRPGTEPVHESPVVCELCRALAGAERKRRRNQVMVRMLLDELPYLRPRRRA
jgi:hypothetical protein